MSINSKIAVVTGSSTGIGKALSIKFETFSLLYKLIPSFDSSGNLNYYVARSIDDLGSFRYKNAKVPKENVIFKQICMNNCSW